MTATSSLLELVRPDLDRVEHELAQTAKTEDPIVEPVLSLVLPGSGKRIRPALALLAARLRQVSPEAGIHMAVGVELLHAASLVHDDVVDQTETRRGEAALFSQVGNAVAVLVGDYLFSQSAARCVATGNLRVIRLFAETLGSMCRGQIEEASRNQESHLTLTREFYYRTIWGKTASLFVLACEGGAILSSLSDAQVSAMRTYGEKLGLAFQIVDDILDFVGDEETLGKPVGSDLRQGIITLPVIYYREELVDGAFRSAFQERSVEDLVELIGSSQAVERCRAEANHLVQQGREALQVLEPGPERDVLESLTYYVTSRIS